MIHWLHTLFHLAYLTTFDPNGYTYARGQWIGQITAIEEDGFFVKTWEGKMRTQKDPDITQIRKYQFLDCVSEQDFSIHQDDKVTLAKVRNAMRAGRVVILNYERRAYPLFYIHGVSNVFVTDILPF